MNTDKPQYNTARDFLKILAIIVFIRSKRRLCPQKDGQAIQKESESLSA